MGRVVLKNILLFCILVAIDQISKKWGSSLSTFHLNHGVMFGMLKDSSLYLRLTTLASIFGFLFSVYIILVYLLSSQLKVMKWGMTLMISGIFGNVLDKIILGASVDFIPAGPFIFNIADIFQWTGAAIILFKVFNKEDVIWYPGNKRGKVLVFRREQFKFSAKLTLAVLCSSLIFGIFCFSFVKAVLFENNIYQTQYLWHFGISYTFLTLIFGTIVFLSGLILSHKTAGPIYSFISYLNDLMAGKEGHKFKLREGDNYLELEKVAGEMESFIKAKQ
jgi:signal peptidase II